MALFARRLLVEVIYIVYLASPALLTANQVLSLLKGEATVVSWDLVVGWMYTIFGLVIHHLASMILDKWESGFGRTIAEFMQAVAYAYPTIFVMLRMNYSVHITTPVAIASGLFMQKVYVALLGRKRESAQTL